MKYLQITLLMMLPISLVSAQTWETGKVVRIGSEGPETVNTTGAGGETYTNPAVSWALVQAGEVIYEIERGGRTWYGYNPAHAFKTPWLPPLGAKIKFQVRGNKMHIETIVEGKKGPKTKILKVRIVSQELANLLPGDQAP